MQQTRDLRQRASDAHRAGRLDEARDLYSQYLARNPGDAGMWSNLGALHRVAGCHDLSLAAQERAHAIDADSPVIANNLANILTDIGRYDRAIALRRRVLAKFPDDTNQKAMIGKALRAKGDYAASITMLEQAVAAHPADTELRMQLALGQLSDRRYADGFRSYGARWQGGELTPRDLPRPEWDGTALDGRRILVLPEQGLGDALTFARFLPVLRQYNPARVLLQTAKPLQRLLTGVDGADAVGSLPGAGDYDVWVNLMDLALPHFKAETGIPRPTCLNMPQDSIARARAATAPHRDQFRVGVVWGGSVTYRGNAFRSFTHRHFHRFLDIPGLQMFSLYKGPELSAFHADGSATLIIDAGSGDRDLADCAATMLQMDLVITSCTVTVHLAGALGVPVWTLLHWDPFWLWQHTGDVTPWYPSMRLCRQDVPRDWDGLFARLHPQVAALAASRRAGA